MIRTSCLFLVIIIGLLFAPIMCFAQTSDDISANHRVSDLLWGICPFIVLGILFWFFLLERSASNTHRRR